MSKKAFLGFISILIALGILLTCAIGSSWFTNSDIKTWFNGWGQSKPIDGDHEGNGDNNPDTPNTDEKGEVSLGDVEEHGISLMSAMIAPEAFADYGVVAQAESAFTVTAKVYDEMGATPDYMQSVTYNVGWASANSAKISDYITLNQSGMTATFSILKAFDMQIILTCTSDLDSTKTATATIDYIRPVSGLTLGSQSASLTGGVYNFTMPDVSADTTNSFYTTSRSLFSVRYGTGTKDATITVVTYSIKATNDFKTACAKAGSVDYLPCTGVMGNRINNIPSVTIQNVLQTCVGSSVIGYPSARYAMYRAMSTTSNQFVVSGTIETNKGNYDFSYYLNFSAVAPAVANITLDKTAFEV